MAVPPPIPPTGPSDRGDRGGLDGETRGWGVAAHLSAFVGAWALVAFIGPLVVYLLGRDRHPSIAHHAREALNFNLTLLLVTVVGVIVAVPVTVGTFGFGLLLVVPIAIVIALAWLILVIVAAVQASDGVAYRYPMTIRFVR